MLLHPGGADSRAWAANLPPLAERFRVYAPDRRGHARTPDVAGPITFDAMARDTIAFVEAVPAAPVDLVGCSDGATVALLVAWLRPDLVKRLVFVCGVFHHEGCCRARSSSTRRPTRSSATGTARSRPTAASTGRS